MGEKEVETESGEACIYLLVGGRDGNSSSSVNGWVGLGTGAGKEENSNLKQQSCFPRTKKSMCMKFSCRGLM